jgi:hypothetical protein
MEIAGTDLKEGEPVIVDGGYNLPEKTAVKIGAEKSEGENENKATAKGSGKSEEREEQTSESQEKGKAEEKMKTGVKGEVK